LASVSPKEKIKRFYQKRYPHIKIIKIISSPALPQKCEKIKFLFSPKTSSGDVLIDGKYYFVKIRAKVPVFVATKVIYQYKPIIPGINVKKKEIKFRFFYSKPLYSIPKNLISNKIISINSVIDRSNTEISPDVLRNQKVSVIIPSQNVSIYTSATALQSGNKGDTIKIKMHGKIFSAIIIKKGVVEIE
jgi:flagella basal body P-ring formation protein FlgA